MTGIRDEATTAEVTLRERFSAPITRAGEITQRTLAWFPIRVGRHFLDHSGFLLAAGVSYQALFAIFAVIYVAFAAAGIWLGASPAAINALIDGINNYVHGAIGDEGLFSREQVVQIAQDSRSVLAVTGGAAIVLAVWTAISFISFARRAVRNIFVLPPDRRNVVLVKARDLIAAVILAFALVAGFVIGSAGTWAAGLIYSALGGDTRSIWYTLGIGFASVLVSFVVYAATLVGLLRFLTGTALGWRTVLPGALLGSGGVTLLQLGAGYLLGYAPRNPLLATFAIVAGLLLWCQAVNVILLFAASWIAVRAHDEHIPLLAPSETERRSAQHEALLERARTRLRSAREARSLAPWWRTGRADRAVLAALDDLLRLEASAPRADGRPLVALRAASPPDVWGAP